MENVQLIGREQEKALLLKYGKSKKAEFVAVYGRRRFGKTFLIKQTLSDSFLFETSGVIQGTRDDQFAAFNQSLRRIGYIGAYVKNWMDAFFALGSPADANAVRPVGRGGIETIIQVT